MKRYSLNDYKKSRLTVISLWLVYASAYFGRTCYSAAVASIVSGGVYEKGEIGLVGTAFFICYGAGQIVSGIAGDRVNPFSMILLGSFGSAACCFSMAFARSLAAMAVIWGLNGIFQSMLWAPLLRIFSGVINERLRKKAVLNIALSLPAGTICSYLCSTVIIKYYEWNSVFLCGGAVVLSAFLIAFFSFLSSKSSIAEDKAQPPLQKSSASNKGAKKGFSAVMLSSGLLIVMLPAFLHGMLRDGITNWVPAMITELYGVSPSFSVFITVALPVFNAFGAYAVTPLYKKLGENEMKAAGICALLSLVPMSLLLLIGKMPVYLSVLLLALTTSSMYALNYLIISRVPVRFADCSHTAGVTGILNSAAYIGCAVSSYGFGAVSQSFGWSAVVVVWIVSAALTVIFSFLSNAKWKGFIKKTL